MIIRMENNPSIPHIDCDNGTLLGMARWEIIDSYLRREEYLVELIRRLKSSSDKYNLGLYLVLGDDTYSDNNRIVNYYKLWGCLKKKNLDIVNGCYSSEVRLERNNQVRFFGGIQILDNNSIDQVVRILQTYLTSHLLLLPEGIDVELLLQNGFSRLVTENGDYLMKIASYEGAAFFKEGFFDDSETGFLGIVVLEYKDKMYAGLQNFLDDGYDAVTKGLGKAVKGTWDTMSSWFGGGAKYVS